jgi:tRNA/rRNA methyltransferase
LLTEAQRDRLEVVLVSPRNPLNIGAAARAMANFGFPRLTVVAPYAPHWQEAQSAVGAEALLINAQQTESLAEALARCTLVLGTGTLTYRKPEQRVVSLPDLAPLVHAELARGGRAALVFGPEKHGLTREDLSYCHLLVEIPTSAQQPSMNLGQAVAVCLYELGTHGFAADHTQASGSAAAIASASDHEPGAAAQRGAAAERLERLAGVVEQAMVAAEYSPAAMREANRHDLRLLLRRLAPTDRDARRILGLFRRILWRLER